MNTTEKAIIVGLGLLVAVGLAAGAAFGFVGQTPSAGQQGRGGMMSGYGGGGMMGGFSGVVGSASGGATSTPTHFGGMMGASSWGTGGPWGMMGNQGLLTNGGNFFMGCVQYMTNYFGIGTNRTAS